MKYLIRPLTRKMITQMRNGRAIELSETGRNICDIDDYKGTLSGLYQRGFVNTKMVMVDGKEIMAVFITQQGLNFLARYEEDRIKLGVVNNTAA